MADPVLDSVVRLFGAAAPAHLATASNIALSLFVLLATLQLTWDLLMWVLRDEPNLVGKAVRKFLILSFFFLLIGAIPLWLPQLLGSFERLGQEVTGLDALSPSSVFFQGVSLAITLFDSWKKVLITLFLPFAGTLQAITFFAVLLSFTVIAFQMARVLVEGALVLGGMVVFLAAAGHRATFGLAEGYLRYALDVGIRVFVVYLLVSVGSDLGPEWDRMVRQATLTELADPRFHLAIPTSAVFFALIVWSVPKTIAAKLGDSFSLSGINPLGDRG